MIKSNKALNNALIGAGGGAIAGGVIGGATSKKGKRGKGIVVGAGVGATVGGGIGYGTTKLLSNRSINKAAPSANKPYSEEDYLTAAKLYSSQLKEIQAKHGDDHQGSIIEMFKAMERVVSSNSDVNPGYLAAANDHIKTLDRIGKRYNVSRILPNVGDEMTFGSVAEDYIIDPSLKDGDPLIIKDVLEWGYRIGPEEHDIIPARVSVAIPKNPRDANLQELIRRKNRWKY